MIITTTINGTVQSVAQSTFNDKDKGEVVSTHLQFITTNEISGAINVVKVKVKDIGNTTIETLRNQFSQKEVFIKNVNVFNSSNGNFVNTYYSVETVADIKVA
jgi:hypothetical protein